MEANGLVLFYDAAVSSPDFERLIGPDRRGLPRPSGLAMAVGAIAVSVVVGLVVLLPRDTPVLDLSAFGFADEVVPATVASVEEGSCSFAVDLQCRRVAFTVEGGALYEQEFPDDEGQPSLQPGDSVLLSEVRFDETTTSFQYYDRDRGTLLIGVAAVFAIAVVALGRMRGLAALAGLVVSILVLVGFIVPAIVAGRDAVLVALVGGGAIALVALYLAHGYTPLTHVAAIGAFGALALTTLLSWAVVAMAGFTGLITEESFYLLELPDLDLSGLLLAGVVLGAIGALDDVTVTQASAVWEVRRANPDLDANALFQSGLRVGRDHIASTVNTLLLAYAGAAMPLLILFSLSQLPLGPIASSEVVAVEVVRTLVGSIGLVSSVPITTWLASRRATRSVP